jgi:hypothetical protein
LPGGSGVHSFFAASVLPLWHLTFTSLDGACVTSRHFGSLLSRIEKIRGFLYNNAMTYNEPALHKAAANGA